MATSRTPPGCGGPAHGAAGSLAAVPRPREPPEHLPVIDYERHPGAATALLPREYRRHEPEKTVLYAIVREHLETFLTRPWLHGGPGYPRFIQEEFRHYLDCGLLCRGFSRLRCPACGFERLVAYSCKGRLCPSCAARRTNDTAAHLVDDLLPAVPYRQWVLSFPFQLRFTLARNPELFGKLVRLFLGIVFAWQRHRGRRLGLADGQTGAVTFLQRFGGALNLNPHAHCVVPDGLFIPSPSGTGPLSLTALPSGHLRRPSWTAAASWTASTSPCSAPLVFYPLPPPTDEEIARLTRRIARRLTEAARPTLGEDGEQFFDDDEEQAVLRHDLADALTPPPGDQTTPWLARGGSHRPNKPLSAVVAGFSLHAARTVDEDDRAGLERLCRYGLRSPFSQERLSLLPDGRVVYRLARPWPTPTGRTELVLDPVDFLRRLAALIPAPYRNMVRYHGVFAGRSRHRTQLPPPPPSRWAVPEAPGIGPDTTAGPANQDQERAELPPQVPLQSPSRPAPRRRTPWATLLRRVFDVDALSCPRCRTPMVVLAFLTDPRVLERILGHLGLPTAPPPVAPPRLPRDDDLVLDLKEDPPDQGDGEVEPAAGRRTRSPPPAPV